MTEFMLPIRPMLLDQFGEAFHSCLRKSLNTRYSVISWNIIRLVEPMVWGGFVNYCLWLLRPKTEITFKEFSVMLKKWDAENYFFGNYGATKDDIQAYGEIRGDKNTIVSIFNATMNCMPDQDILELMRALDYNTDFNHA